VHVKPSKPVLTAPGTNHFLLKLRYDILPLIGAFSFRFRRYNKAKALKAVKGAKATKKPPVGTDG